jgi:hypothetical protein
MNFYNKLSLTNILLSFHNWLCKFCNIKWIDKENNNLSLYIEIKFGRYISQKNKFGRYKRLMRWKTKY